MSEGIKWDNGKPRLTLVDPEFSGSMARVLHMGEERYGKGNWKNGIAFSRLLDAARRHIAAVESGEDIDPDSGFPHVAHVACNMMFIHYFMQLGRDDLDDRHYRNRDLPVPSVQEGQETRGIHPEPLGEEGLPVPDMRQLGALGESSEATRSSGATGDPVKNLQHRITTWADRVFPNRTADNALSKLVLHEIPELLHGGLDDPSEYADVLILVLDIAQLRGIDAIQAAHDKMAINEQRQWKIDPHTGLMQHIE